MSKSQLPSKTYTTILDQDNDEKHNLEVIGRVLGIIRNDDYCYLVDCYNNDYKVSKHDRRKRLMNKYLISSREADSIVYSNNEQLELVKRTVKDNVKDWEKEIKQYQKQFNNLKDKNKSDNTAYKKRYYAGLIQKLQSKIIRAQEKSPSCCFGGKKLQKRITQYPNDYKSRQDWVNKRLFLSFMGNSGRSKGNDIIKLDVDTGALIARISDGLQSLCAFNSKTLPIGKVNFKHGNNSIKTNIVSNKAIYYKFVWNTRKRKWYAHTTVKISLEEQENNFNAKVKHSPVKVFDRTCGIDQNSGFITATIIDKHANPVNKLTLEHSHSKDISSLVSKLVVWAMNNGVYRFSIEKLKSLNYKKRKSNGSGSGLNRIVSRIPFGEFKECLNTIAGSYGLQVVEVSPYNTSKNTKYWSEDRFGVTVHEKASYLIARKSLGLSILRRDHFNDYPEENRVSWRAISLNDGSILCNSHDNSLVDSERVMGCGS